MHFLHGFTDGKRLTFGAECDIIKGMKKGKGVDPGLSAGDHVV